MTDRKKAVTQLQQPLIKESKTNFYNIQNENKIRFYLQRQRQPLVKIKYLHPQDIFIFCLKQV